MHTKRSMKEPSRTILDANAQRCVYYAERDNDQNMAIIRACKKQYDKCLELSELLSLGVNLTVATYDAELISNRQLFPLEILKQKALSPINNRFTFDPTSKTITTKTDASTNIKPSVNWKTLNRVVFQDDQQQYYRVLMPTSGLKAFCELTVKKPQKYVILRHCAKTPKTYTAIENIPVKEYKNRVSCETEHLMQVLKENKGFVGVFKLNDKFYKCECFFFANISKMAAYIEQIINEHDPDAMEYTDVNTGKFIDKFRFLSKKKQMKILKVLHNGIFLHETKTMKVQCRTPIISKKLVAILGMPAIHKQYRQ